MTGRSNSPGLWLTAAALSCLAGCPFSAPAEVTRGDLAATYIQFEGVYRSQPPADNLKPEFNRLFDQATFAFFGGNRAEAVRQINELIGRLLGSDARRLSAETAAALKLAVDPPVALADGRAVRARIASMYAVDATPGKSVELLLRVRSGDGRITHEQPLKITFDLLPLVDLWIPLHVDTAKWAPGAYEVFLTGGARESAAFRWNIVARSPETLRSQNSRRLRALSFDDPTLKQALAACKARNNLLTDDPDPDESIQLLSNLTTLARDVESELQALEAGQNPYARRAGNYWRVVTAGDVDVPLRVYAPAAAALPDAAPLPLLIALHGAGGDENLFFEGYGAGELIRLAAQRNLIVLAPRTDLLIRQPDLIEPILSVAQAEYPVDSKRIYLLGHSLGGVTASLLASQQPQRYAAAVCICGVNRLSPTAPLPPLRVYAAELDPISAPQRIEQSVAGVDAVTFTRVPGRGHTLVVPEVLPEALDWLLSRKR